jgi:hypothetical protein
MRLFQHSRGGCKRSWREREKTCKRKRQISLCKNAPYSKCRDSTFSSFSPEYGDCISLKCWCLPTSRRSVMTQKTNMEIFNAVRI